MNDDELINAFMSKPQAIPEITTIPKGVTIENLVQFAATPAGESMIRNMAKRVKQGRK